MSECMIDIETLGTGAEAIVIGVGAVAFDDMGHELDAKIWVPNIQEQINRGRVPTEATILWWVHQLLQKDKCALRLNSLGKVAYNNDGPPLSNGMSLNKFCQELYSFLERNYCNEIWSYGCTFDIGILTNLITQVGGPLQWSHRKIRDLRTIFNDPEVCEASLWGETVNDHNPLNDARNQIKALMNYRKE